MKDGVRIVNAARGELVDDRRADRRRSSRARSPAPRSTSSRRSRTTGRCSQLAERRRDAAPRGVDRGGAGPRRRDRRRAGRRGARRRARHERGQHPDGRRRRPRGARPVRAARGEARAPGDGARGGRDVRRLDDRGATASSPSYDTRLLTVAALNGAFQGHTDQPVNYVNAPLVAADRGIDVVEEQAPARRATTRTSSRSPADDVRVAGTTIGTRHRHWLVRALGFELEMELAPLLVLFRYDDVPGVIGRVGTLFGEAGVNIANMAVSRNREGGKALMALSIDSPRAARSSSSSCARRHRRRLPDHRVADDAWPEPVERVAAVLRAAARRRADRGVPGGDADRAATRPRRSAASSSRSSSRSSSSATARTCSRSSPATGAPTSSAVAAALGAPEVRVARADEVVRGDRLRARRRSRRSRSGRSRGR